LSENLHLNFSSFRLTERMHYQFTEVTIDNKRIYCLQYNFFWTTLYIYI